MTKEHNKEFRTLLNVGSMTKIVLIMMLKQESIVISRENIDTLHIDIAITILS